MRLVIKLGKVSVIGALNYRAAPITILQRLGLVEEIAPLSHFYYKIPWLY